MEADNELWTAGENSLEKIPFYERGRLVKGGKAGIGPAPRFFGQVFPQNDMGDKGEWVGVHIDREQTPVLTSGQQIVVEGGNEHGDYCPAEDTLGKMGGRHGHRRHCGILTEYTPG